MTILTLVRHGETDWNRDRRIQGTTDIPLNDVGRQQARATGLALLDALDPDLPRVVVSSDLSRAVETAEIIAAELGTVVSAYYPQLRERAYGEAEGVDAAEYVARWGTPPTTADIPGAEPWPHVRRRAVRALRTVARDARRRTAPAAASVVVVTHGGVIRELVRHATRGDLPLPETRMPNGASYTLLVERERMRVLSSLGIPA